MKRLRTYYTYVDITKDDRPFYVGKGNKSRLTAQERNDVWSNIVQKHGFKRRIVVFETLHEQWAFDKEVELIALFKTNMHRVGHWGANLTDGGEGSSGYKHTEHALKQMRAAKVGWKPSAELLKKASDANKGRKRSADAVKRSADAHRGQKRSLETRHRLSLSHMHRYDATHPDAAPKQCLYCYGVFTVHQPLTMSHLKAHLAKRFCGRKCARSWCNVQRTGIPRPKSVKLRIAETLRQR